jgi:hypothetical protein
MSETESEKRSLYERLGGVYSIATVVEDLIDRVDGPAVTGADRGSWSRSRSWCRPVSHWTRSRDEAGLHAGPDLMQIIVLRATAAKLKPMSRSDRARPTPPVGEASTPRRRAKDATSPKANRASAVLSRRFVGQMLASYRLHQRETTA